MADLEDAISLAVQAHRGQKDSAGAPYILHPLRMMFRVETDAEKIVAVLHDVVEDTAWTLDGLRAEGFPEDVVAAVDHLTRRESESYEEFVRRAAAHPVARRVKIADLEDNMDVRRTGTVTQKDVDRLTRYHRAWRSLTADLPGE
ncbi:MAG TPA: HD domain-containing protein [Longimicrobiaceae bacterium]|nr:HD domain-containing protein [Longimicrobiaceae bacterium]